MNKFEMNFDLNTIEHLGVRMYSTLPPVIAELISNAYDADANSVKIYFDNSDQKEILVVDDGHGMSFNDMNEKFLKIGRDRREEESSQKSLGGRLLIGKKGIGKLSFFGIAHQIKITSIKDGKLNSFLMDWDKMMSDKNKEESSSVYSPEPLAIDEETDLENMTKIVLKKINRESDFDIVSIADSISKYFILDDDFKVFLFLEDNSIEIKNERKYENLDTEIFWDIPSDLDLTKHFMSGLKVTGKLFSTKKPISPSSNMRGITLFSRKKLVNKPEYFASSESNHFFSYLTGWLNVDFIEDLDSDVISTSRQSLNWDFPDLVRFREVLNSMIKELEKDWRKKRSIIRSSEINEVLQKKGITIEDWRENVPTELNKDLDPLLEYIIEKSEFSETDVKKTVSLIEHLIPSYTYFHYQNLEPTLSKVVIEDYKSGNYYNAVAQGVTKYIREVQKKSSSELTDGELIKHVFIPNQNPGQPLVLPELCVVSSFMRPDGTDFEDDTKKNVKKGHGMLAHAMWLAFRNPIHHELSVDLKDSGLYTEQDCLDALGLLSHLFRRLYSAI